MEIIGVLFFFGSIVYSYNVLFNTKCATYWKTSFSGEKCKHGCVIPIIGILISFGIFKINESQIQIESNYTPDTNIKKIEKKEPFKKIKKPDTEATKIKTVKEESKEQQIEPQKNSSKNYEKMFNLNPIEIKNFIENTNNQFSKDDLEEIYKFLRDKINYISDDILELLQKRKILKERGNSSEIQKINTKILENEKKIETLFQARIFLDQNFKK